MLKGQCRGARGHWPSCSYNRVLSLIKIYIYISPSKVMLKGQCRGRQGALSRLQLQPCSVFKTKKVNFSFFPLNPGKVMLKGQCRGARGHWPSCSYNRVVFKKKKKKNRSPSNVMLKGQCRGR